MPYLAGKRALTTPTPGTEAVKRVARASGPETPAQLHATGYEALVRGIDGY